MRLVTAGAKCRSAEQGPREQGPLPSPSVWLFKSFSSPGRRSVDWTAALKEPMHDVDSMRFGLRKPHPPHLLPLVAQRRPNFAIFRPVLSRHYALTNGSAGGKHPLGNGGAEPRQVPA